MTAIVPTVTPYRPRREPRHETLRVRGIDLHLRRWGPVPDHARPAIWLLHGWLDSGATFQFLVDAFTADLPLVAPDWRGFGQSGWAADGYLFADYLADLDALLDQCSPGTPVTLIGHSMGANVASIYAGVRPERVRALVNLEGFGLDPTVAGDAPRHLRQWLDELQRPPPSTDYASFAQLEGVIRRRNPRFTAAQVAYLARAWADTNAEGRVRLHGDARHRRIQPTLYRREEACACWEAIRAPVLVLAGADSGYIARLGGESLIEGFRRCVPQSTLARIPGAGHLLHIDRPDTVASLIEAFLARHLPEA